MSDKKPQREPVNPKTPEEWQEVVDMADAFLRVDSARRYGLITGGPAVNVSRCDELLAQGKARGIVPDPARVELILRTLAYGPAEEGKKP
jgi:hypothetical protein